MPDNSTLLVTHWVALLILYRKGVKFSATQDWPDCIFTFEDILSRRYKKEFF